MPKKILSLLLSLCLLISLTGCGNNQSAGAVSNTQETQYTTENSVPTETESSPTQTSPSVTEPDPVPTESESEPIVTEPEATETEPESQETEPPISNTVPETEPETETEPEVDLIEPDSEDMDSETLWTPLCDSHINLWKTASGSESICKIPVGATFELLGWHGKYAQVRYQGRRGYVSANYIQPVDKDYFAKRLKVVAPTTQYSYTQMLSDMQALRAMYPELIQLSTIGKSEAGLDIPVLILGDPNAPDHVLMQGAMHGREHFTAWLLMAIVDNSLVMDSLSDKSVCYHIIPMSNPDGVAISQTQSLNAAQDKIYQKDLSYGYTTSGKASYAQQWKANGLGIDLNRNFPAGWSVSKEHPEASSSNYRGESALCAAESKALANYTKSRKFSATLSFHSHGSVLYYRYGNKQPVNNTSYSLALDVQALTGYIPVANDGTTGAGYKDWVIDELGIPSLTIEIGSSQTPVPQQDLYNTFSRFEEFLPTISIWLT